MTVAITKNYLDLLPNEIQDKIWTDVFQHYRKEHQSKFTKVIYDATNKALVEEYWRTIHHILSIEDPNEQAMELTMFYQWLADNKRILYSSSTKYNEVLLRNPYQRRCSLINTVSSCWRKDFEKRGLDWFADPIYEPTEANDDSFNNDTMNIDLWVELAPQYEIKIAITISIDLVD